VKPDEIIAEMEAFINAQGAMNGHAKRFGRELIKHMQCVFRQKQAEKEADDRRHFFFHYGPERPQ
jgi:hypothetical protein